MKNLNFEDTRPYYDEEIPEAIKRISENIHFPNVVKYLFPEADIREFTEFFNNIKTTDEFQTKIMHNVLHQILKQTIDNFTGSGLEQLTNDKSYMFISNHRDIMLDSAFLQLLLYDAGLKTSEITFGDNLMSSQFIIDIGKINKMFKIVRGGTTREIFANSLKVSSYMRYAITEKQQSIWIAQRNGRTKNGNDITDVAVLKMFAMSSKKDFVSNLSELNITPTAVSYEYEPCDFLKTRELYILKRKEYVKEPGEDLISIIRGIKQWKGNMHIAISDTITEDELRKCDSLENNEKFKELAKIIDKRIYSNYKLWKTNYIAYDILNNTNQYSSEYSENERNNFISYMNEGLKNIDGDIKELESIFLKIYSNPINNFYNI